MKCNWKLKTVTGIEKQLAGIADFPFSVKTRLKEQTYYFSLAVSNEYQVSFAPAADYPGDRSCAWCNMA